MQVVCPECNTSTVLKVSDKGTRVSCRKCSTDILIPVELMRADYESTKQVDDAHRRLEIEYQKGWHRLEDDFKARKKRLEQEYRKTARQSQEVERGDSHAVKTPIVKKLIISVLSIYFLVVFAVNGAQMVYQYFTTKNFIVTDLKSSETIFGKGLGESVWNMDSSGVSSIITGMLEHPVIIGVKILDDTDELIASKGSYIGKDGTLQHAAFSESDDQNIEQEAGTPEIENNMSRLFWYSFPIVYTSDDGTSNTIGGATVYSTKSFVFQRIKGGYLLITLNALLVALALWLTFLWVSRVVLAHPLSILTNAVSKLNFNNLDSLEVNINTTSRNELKVLEESFNAMVRNLVEEKRTIEQLTKTFEKFIPKQFLSRIAEQGISSIRLGGMEEEHLTVLYMEIHSFHSLAEQLDGRELFSFLNDYLTRMDTIIEAHGGFIYKFDKQSIIALFDLNDRSMEAYSAIYSAIDMQKSLDIFNKEQQQNRRPIIQSTIGIYSGSIQLGTLGSEMRIESTALGNAVDMAIQLQSQARKLNSQILISKDTFDLAESDDSFQWRELDTIQMVDKEIQIVEILDADPLKEPKLKIREEYHKGLECYRNRRWDEALKIFEHCLSIYSMDIASQNHIRRCKDGGRELPVLTTFLEGTDLFNKLRSEDIGKLVPQFVLKSFEPYIEIIRQGDHTDSFFIIYEGMVEVFGGHGSKEKTLLETLQRGDCFGEESLLTGKAAKVSVRSKGEVKLLVLRKKDFEAILRDFPRLNRYFLKRFLQNSSAFSET